MKPDRVAELKRQHQEAATLWLQAEHAMTQHREAMLRIEGAVLEAQRLPDDPLA